MVKNIVVRDIKVKVKAKDIQIMVIDVKVIMVKGHTDQSHNVQSN